VSKTKQFAARVAVVAGAATLVVASAFADSRPSNETSWRGGNRGSERRDGDRGRDNDRRGDNSRNGRGDDRRGDSRDNGRYERNDRQQQRNQPYYANGRVSRVDRYRDGYRVYVGGAQYPFYVPSRYYNRDRFRIGVSINIGGILNPGGYYDYYDNRGVSRGDIRGVVESVDHRRDTFVVRNEASGSFVTVISADRRREVRPGDYVELYGDWSRNGVFRARDVDVLDRY
jgi:hypothetical protein